MLVGQISDAIFILEGLRVNCKTNIFILEDFQRSRLQKIDIKLIAKLTPTLTRRLPYKFSNCRILTRKSSSKYIWKKIFKNHC